MNERSKTFDEGEAQLIPEAWKLYPHTLAAKASGGRWMPYPWLRYLSTRLAPAIINGGGRFVITGPPQHGKSEFISNWVPTWFLNNFPNRKVILASYAADYATKWGSKVKENLSDNQLISIPIAEDTHSKKRFVTQAGGQMISVGIGGQATGEGADLFIIDDPIKNWQEAMSQLIRDRNYDWTKSVATTRLQPGATIILLQTCWHEDDLAHRLEEEGYERINFEALCENPDQDVLGRSLGEALCPARYTAENLATIRDDLGEIFWSAMYQGAPISQKGNIIRGDWIQFYDELPDSMDEMSIFADLSYKDGEENDFAVFECWGRKGPNIYLVGQVRAQMDFPDQLTAFGRIISAYPRAYHKEIEDKANGSALISMVKATVNGVIANNPKTDKTSRLAAVSSLYKSGNVWYPNPDKQPWVKVNIAEITKFPKAKHDDTVDVASMAVNHLGRMGNALKRLTALSKW